MGEGVLTTDGVRLARIADAVGTPAYVYSAESIRSQYRALDRALAPVPHRLCYSVKANGNLAILGLLRSLGAGVDIVSSGELARALKAGFAGADVVFSGVGKTPDEMRAALDAGVGMLNVESEEELDVLAGVARVAGKTAPVAIRVNPEVMVDVHPYTATGVKGKKFGVPYDEALALAQKAAKLQGVSLIGIAMHIGSGITAAEPFVEAVVKVLELVADVRQSVTTLRRLDLGGGLGIRYKAGDAPLDVQAYADALLPPIAASRLELVLEPVRFIVGNAGTLLTRVLYRKKSGGRMIAVIDAGMTDLIRPSHYQAWHEIEVDRPADRRSLTAYDVVGPICESGDFLALDRELPELQQGDLLAVRGAGAYGFVMTSTYNARPRPPEVLVDGGKFAVIRERETVEDLMRGESLDPDWMEASRLPDRPSARP